MFKRGVQTLFLLLLMLFKSSYLLADDSITLTYTVAPSQSFLSGKLDRGTKYIGGYHSLIKELTKDMNITLKYIPYSDYNKAIQNTMIYNPSKTPEIILGNFFDEDKTPYLYYFDYPIYQDYMVFIANKEFLPKDFKPIKGDLENSIYSLLNSNIPLQITGQVFPITLDIPYKTEDNIEKAMENVFVNGNFLITTYTTISDYLEKNKETSKLNSLIIFKYPNITANYFMGINKKSELFTTKYDEDNFMIDKIKENLKHLVISKEILNILEN